MKNQPFANIWFGKAVWSRSFTHKTDIDNRFLRFSCVVPKYFEQMLNWHRKSIILQRKKVINIFSQQKNDRKTFFAALGKGTVARELYKLIWLSALPENLKKMLNESKNNRNS